jgi:hypothetical protein
MDKGFSGFRNKKGFIFQKSLQQEKEKGAGSP